MNTGKLASRLAMGALLCTTVGGAHAAAVTLTGWTYGSGQSVNVTAPNYSGKAGGFKGSLSGAGGFDTGLFETYCVELTEHFSFSSSPMQNYELVAGTDYFSAAKALSLGKLVSYVNANPGAVDDSRESASMQLAIWNVIYDTDLSLTGGSFRDSSTLNTYAGQLLSASSQLLSSAVEVFVLRKAGSQDFLLTRASLSPQSVPEPASGWLALAALGAWGGATGWRRRRNKM